MRSGLISPGVKIYTLTDTPPLFVRGEGATLTDEAGKDYTDMASGSSVMHVGYGNQEVSRAILEQVNTGITHIGPHFMVPAQISMLESIKALLPSNLSQIHPATNGTEANEVAIKLCQYATGKTKFVTFQGSYHGRTAGSIAISGARGRSTSLGPFLPAAEVFPYPCCDACPRRGADDTCCGRAEEFLLDALGSASYGLTDLAGIFIEPIQGTAGMIVPPKRFLKTVCRRARELGIPIVFDEVFTAFGRTGKMFAYEHFDVMPDILVLAKSIGGGIPAGMVAASADMFARVPPGAISSTFQLHPVAAAAGYASLNYVLRNNLPQKALIIEGWFQAALSGLAQRSSVAALRGIGAMFGLVIHNANGEPDAQHCKKIRRKCLENGLITYECGRAGEVIGLLPPLVISRGEFDRGISVLLDAIR
jgi:4-aminobutyrate aminotransferase-like enzyme